MCNFFFIIIDWFLLKKSKPLWIIYINQHSPCIFSVVLKKLQSFIPSMLKHVHISQKCIHMCTNSVHPYTNTLNAQLLFYSNLQHFLCTWHDMWLQEYFWDAQKTVIAEPILLNAAKVFVHYGFICLIVTGVDVRIGFFANK